MTDDDIEIPSGTGTIVCNLTDSCEENIETPKVCVVNSNPTTPHIGLSEIMTLKDKKDLASIVASLVGEQFLFSVTKIFELCTQLEMTLFNP